MRIYVFEDPPGRNIHKIVLLKLLDGQRQPENLVKRIRTQENSEKG